jgi:WD domain, G-beta repeat
VWAAAFSPDGKRLATASRDRTAKLWDLVSGKELFTLSGHTAELRDIAFSPDGSRLVTASEDKAKVWDAASARELFTLGGGHQLGSLMSLAFSPDGKRLATASIIVRVFAPETQALMALARSHLTRTLTDEECRRYLHGERCPPWVAALDWFIKGKKQAQAVKVHVAVASLRKAKGLDPSLDLDPTTEAGRLAAVALVAEGERLAMQGKVKEAIKALQRQNSSIPA